MEERSVVVIVFLGIFVEGSCPLEKEVIFILYLLGRIVSVSAHRLCGFDKSFSCLIWPTEICLRFVSPFAGFLYGGRNGFPCCLIKSASGSSAWDVDGGIFSRRELI